MISNIILLQGGAKKKTKSCIDIIFVCDYNITNTKYVSSLFNSVMLKQTNAKKLYYTVYKREVLCNATIDY